jgi:hypothetical protein
MKELKVKIECTFAGYSTKKNGDVDVRFKAPYSEIVNTISLVRMIDRNIGVVCKINGGKPIPLGTFYLNKLSIDRDGESTINFNTELNSAEVNNMTELLVPESIIHILAKCVVEDEENDQ